MIAWAAFGILMVVLTTWTESTGSTLLLTKPTGPTLWWIHTTLWGGRVGALSAFVAFILAWFGIINSVKAHEEQLAQERTILLLKAQRKEPLTPQEQEALDKLLSTK